MISRDSSWELLKEYTKSESLRKHALGVEAVMRAYARKSGEDEIVWGIVGMLHDFDYEVYPTSPDHPNKGAAILRERGYPDEWVTAISSHVDCMNIPRNTLLAKTLFACDELVGFITACALVRPGKTIRGMEPKSVRKKLKDKAFARSVNREDIYKGVAELNVDLDEHIRFCIDAMSQIAEILGLAGAPTPAEAQAAGEIPAD